MKSTESAPPGLETTTPSHVCERCAEELDAYAEPEARGQACGCCGELVWPIFVVRWVPSPFDEAAIAMIKAACALARTPNVTPGRARTAAGLLDEARDLFREGRGTPGRQRPRARRQRAELGGARG